MPTGNFEGSLKTLWLKLLCSTLIKAFVFSLSFLIISLLSTSPLPCYAEVENGEVWLINSYIAPYEQAKTWGHEERRRRKLLVTKRELSKLWSETQRKGMTLVPLVLYFNHRGIAKLKIGVAKGKKNYDKRSDQAKRDWGRQKQRLLRQGE